jgi:hypothetical protein
MATREQVLAQLAQIGDDARAYDEAGRRLGISPGLAYLLATGRPADGSGTAADAAPPTDAPLLSSPQALANPSAVKPAADPKVRTWMRERAARELHLRRD